MIQIEDLPPKYRKQAEAKINAQSDRKRKMDKLVESDNKIVLNERQEPTRGKYGNIRCEIDGIKFDSKKERARFLELKQMFDTGEISDLRLQHHFTLSETFTTAYGEKINKIEYIADFSYTGSEGNLIIEDVKSEATRKNAVYRLKKRLMAAAGYKITEV